MINDTLDLVADQIDNNTISYTKDVPEKSASYAAINTVGGMTRKCTNLAKPQGGMKPNGFETVLNDDGSITLSGSAVSKVDTVIHLLDSSAEINMAANKTYKLTVYRNGSDAARYGCRIEYDDDIGGSVYAWNNQDITRPRKLVRVFIQFTPEISESPYNGTYTIMLNEGETALPYEPYFEGLRSAPVTGVESVGVNLIPFPYVDGMSKTHNGITYTVNSDGSIHAKGTAEGNSYFYLTHAIEWNDKTTSAMDSVKTLNGKTYKDCMYYSANKQLMLSLSTGISVDRTYFPMINKGDTALPYTPYVRNSLPIPDEVKALDGYGWGINESVFNYIDWEKKQFVKRVGCVDIGEATKGYNPDLAVFSIQFTKAAKPRTSNALSVSYTPTSLADLNRLTDKSFNVSGNGSTAFLKDSAYADIATFKPAMSGVMLYYELAEPIITDISHLLTSDNLISVEGNGTITFKNEYNYDIPNEVIFYTSDSSNETIAVESVVGDLIGTASKAIADGDGNIIIDTYAKITDVPGAAGTSLGLVKSGGDVTISDGVITVNDDSHNHVIGNVDGLQTALDGKVNAVTQTSADLNTLTTSGFYRMGGSNANMPTSNGYGQLLVMHGGGDTITQIYGDYKKGTLYTRSDTPADVGGDGSWCDWKELADTDVATTSAKGLMSAADKTKLDGIAAGANKTTVDSSLSSTSTNPVQNKAIHTALASKADLVDGKVPSSQLPSYVDDVLEYSAKSSFPTTGESGKIYVDIATNKTYRWSGSAYVEISASLAIGTTASTAAAGNHTHSSYVNQNAFSNIKVGDTTIAADTTTDTFTLVAGNNITLTPDATNDKITISATNTTYTLGSFGITATAAELNYVDGVTSNIQTQLNNKAAVTFKTWTTADMI